MHESHSYRSHSEQKARESVNYILELMTPEEVLEQQDFPLPELLTPPEYPSFDDVLAERDRIRRLQLVPVKDDDGYANYHAQSRETLRRMVEQYFANGTKVMVRNVFPYALPEDLEQWILWLQDPDTTREDIALYLAKMLERKALTSDDMVIFERPLHTRSKMVRGTFPEYRHIHVWLRKQE